MTEKALKYLSNWLQAASKLDLVNTMVHGLAIGGTFGHGALAASTAHTYTVDDVACVDESTNDLKKQKTLHVSYRHLTNDFKQIKIQT